MSSSTSSSRSGFTFEGTALADVEFAPNDFAANVSSPHAVGLAGAPSAPSLRRNLVKVVILLAVLFLGLEGLTRYKLFRMSKDFVRFSSYAKDARILTESDGIRIALIGNSATQRGVDMGQLKSDLSGGKTGTVSADMFVADASRINTWHFMMNRYFWRPRLQPDLFVVTYYENELEDGNGIEIGRMAQFFTTPSDWPEVFRTDISENSQRADFVISSFWATFAARDRLKERVLKVAVPDYADYLEESNGINYRHAVLEAKGKPKVSTHRALARMLKLAREHGSKLCFVAFPTREPAKPLPYDLNGEAVRMIRDAGMYFVDLRKVPGLSPDKYADEIHLNDLGRPIYTRRLAQEIATFLQRHDGQMAKR